MQQAGSNYGASAEQAAERQQQQAAMEEQRQQMVYSILTPEAKTRLSMLAMVKEDKVRMVEDQLIKMATSGALRERVSEAQLIEMLDKVVQSSQTKVKIMRRPSAFPDEDDDDSDSDLL